MNFDYSIENLVEKIQNTKTKIYFQEVYQTYVNKNYRSSIVMLYSVLICDLIFKLKDLRDIYSDDKASKILNEIETLQINKPNSPDWEMKLVDLIKERTNLLEASDIVAIESLQKFRHLSAHPVIKNSDLLFSPNKETVQALIRNILEGVFINPPFFSNKIFDTMLDDILDVQNSIENDEALEKYLTSRYINRLKDEDFKKVYRSLWKIVYISNDSKAVSNLNLNYSVLLIFTKLKKPFCKEILNNEPDYYSNITKPEKIKYLIGYLTRYPDLYDELNDSLKLIIKRNTNTNPIYNFWAWFITKDLKLHLREFNKQNFNSLDSNSINFMLKIAMDNGAIKEYLDFLIDYFDSSKTFDTSSLRLSYIDDILKRSMSLQQAILLLEKSNSNSQIYESWYVPAKIQEIVKKYELDIDKKLFDKIYKSIDI